MRAGGEGRFGQVSIKHVVYIMVLPLVFGRQVHEMAILYPAKSCRIGWAGKDMAFKFQFTVWQQCLFGVSIGESDPVVVHVEVFVAKMPGNEIEHGVDDSPLEPEHGLGESKGVVDALHDRVLVKE